jgi:hypothetical protein
VRRAVGLAAAFVVLATGCGGGREEVAALPEGRFLAVERTLTPEVQLFGDPVRARVDVIVDTERFDPDRIRLEGAFAPYELDGQIERSRRDQGRYSHLRYELTLRCLVWDCLPHTDDPGATPISVGGGVQRPPPPGGVRDRRTHRLKSARLLYDDPRNGAQPLSNVGWPEVVSVSRLNFSDRDVSVLGWPFEASVTPLPDVSYRLPPALLGGGLLAAALLLLALPAALLVRWRRGAEPPPEPEPERELSPLERALLLVEWSRSGEPDDRREALEALAFELETDSRAELAGDVRKLAWSRAAPSPEELDEILGSARETEQA